MDISDVVDVDSDLLFEIHLKQWQLKNSSGVYFLAVFRPALAVEVRFWAVVQQVIGVE